MESQGNGLGRAGRDVAWSGVIGGVVAGSGGGVAGSGVVGGVVTGSGVIGGVVARSGVIGGKVAVGSQQRERGG